MANKNIVFKNPVASLCVALEMNLIQEDVSIFSTLGGMLNWAIDEAQMNGRLQEFEENLNEKIHSKRKKQDSSRSREPEGEVQYGPALF